MAGCLRFCSATARQDRSQLLPPRLHHVWGDPSGTTLTKVPRPDWIESTPGILDGALGSTLRLHPHQTKRTRLGQWASRACLLKVLCQWTAVVRIRACCRCRGIGPVPGKETQGPTWFGLPTADKAFVVGLKPAPIDPDAPIAVLGSKGSTLSSIGGVDCQLL